MTLGKALLMGLGLLASGVVVTAQARVPEDAGAYAGVAVGHGEVRLDGGSRDNRTDEDFSDTTLGVYGGYRFNRYFSIEGGFTDLGGYDYMAQCPAGMACVPESVPERVDAALERWDIAVMGSVPFAEQFDAYAKLGWAESRATVDTSSMSTGQQRSVGHSSDVLYGIGVRWHMDAPWSLRLQWDHVSSEDFGDADINTYSLGVEYRFGG